MILYKYVLLDIFQVYSVLARPKSPMKPQEMEDSIITAQNAKY